MGSAEAGDRSDPVHGESARQFVFDKREHTFETAAFEAWAAKVWQVGAGLGAEVSLADFRKNIILDFYNEAGQLAISYKIYRAWVSEYQALPELDANANAVAIQHIILENEGWERDTSVQEQAEISYNSTSA